MRFSMLKISGSKQNDGNYVYESMIMEKGASTPWRTTFETEFEMVSLMTNILARQRRDRDARHVLSSVHAGEHYFFDLDLTEKQAEALGWQAAEVAELVGAN